MNMIMRDIDSERLICGMQVERLGGDWAIGIDEESNEGEIILEGELPLTGTLVSGTPCEICSQGESTCSNVEKEFVGLETLCNGNKDSLNLTCLA